MHAGLKISIFHKNAYFSLTLINRQIAYNGKKRILGFTNETCVHGRIFWKHFPKTGKLLK